MDCSYKQPIWPLKATQASIHPVTHFHTVMALAPCKALPLCQEPFAQSLTPQWDSQWEQTGMRPLPQGLFDMQTAGTGNGTNSILMKWTQAFSPKRWNPVALTAIQSFLEPDPFHPLTVFAPLLWLIFSAWCESSVYRLHSNSHSKIPPGCVYIWHAGYHTAIAWGCIECKWCMEWTSVLWKSNFAPPPLSPTCPPVFEPSAAADLLHVLRPGEEALVCDHCMQNVALFTSWPPLTLLQREGD